MPRVADPYLTLGVERAATLAQIKAAHRRLAKSCHPDVAGGDAARFLAVQEAYQLLRDVARRREWDIKHPSRTPVAAPARPRPRPWARDEKVAAPPRRPEPTVTASPPPLEAPGEEGYPYRTVAGAAWSHAGRATIRNQFVHPYRREPK